MPRNAIAIVSRERVNWEFRMAVPIRPVPWSARRCKASRVQAT